MKIPPPGSLVEVRKGPIYWYSVDDRSCKLAAACTRTDKSMLQCVWDYAFEQILTDHNRLLVAVFIEYAIGTGSVDNYYHIKVLHPEHGVIVGRATITDELVLIPVATELTHEVSP